MTKSSHSKVTFLLSLLNLGFKEHLHNVDIKIFLGGVGVLYSLSGTLNNYLQVE